MRKRYAALLLIVPLLTLVAPAHAAGDEGKMVQRGHTIVGATDSATARGLGRAGADKHVVMKRQPWSAIAVWVEPNLYNAGSHIVDARLTAVTYYLFWPDGAAVNKIAPVRRQICYDMGGERTALLQNVSLDVEYEDDNNVVNPVDITVDRSGDSECKGYDIGNDIRRWLRMDQAPSWIATARVALKLRADFDVHFRWRDSITRYFTPGDDPNEGDWFYCACDWPGAGN